MSPTTLISRGRARLMCLSTLVMALGCAGVLIAAVLVPAPVAVLPVLTFFLPPPAAEPRFGPLRVRALTLVR